MSWAEDNGFDAFDEEDFYGRSSNTKEYEWEDKNHHIRLISDLDTSHIKNIIRGLEAGKSYWHQSWKLDYLKKELKKRHNFSGKETF